MQEGMTNQCDKSDLDWANVGSNEDFAIDMDEKMVRQMNNLPSNFEILRLLRIS
jgi:hypothetical protein